MTHTHVTGGIRACNSSKRGHAELRFRPRGHWHRRSNNIAAIKHVFLALALMMITKQQWDCTFQTSYGDIIIQILSQIYTHFTQK